MKKEIQMKDIICPAPILCIKKLQKWNYSIKWAWNHFAMFRKNVSIHQITHMIFYQHVVYVYVLAELYAAQRPWWLSWLMTQVSRRRHLWNFPQSFSIQANENYRVVGVSMLMRRQHGQRLEWANRAIVCGKWKKSHINRPKWMVTATNLLQLSIGPIFLSAELSNINNHFTTCLVPFTVIGLLFDLLMDAFACGSIFQCKLWNYSTHFIWSRFKDAMLWHTQPQ